MKYLNKQFRKEVADALRSDVECCTRYRDKQPPHGRGGINIRRATAEGEIKRLQAMINQLIGKDESRAE